MRVLACLLLLTLVPGCAVRHLRPENSLSGETTLVGCLDSGGAPGEYVLTDSRDPGRKTIVTGNPDLARHIPNHAVRVVGPLDRETRGLKATRIDHLAASCRTPF